MTRISEFPLPGNSLPQNIDDVPLGHLHGVSGMQPGKPEETEEVKIKKNIKKRYLEVILIFQIKSPINDNILSVP
jgi:hypothetical protein